MPHSLKPLLRLKWLILKRIPSDIPPAYLVLLAVFALSAGWFLTKIPLPVNVKTIAAVAFVHYFLCTRLDYASAKTFFLRQFPHFYVCSLLIDTLFAATLYLLINPWFWLTGVCVSVLYAVAKNNIAKNVFLRKFPVIPSPFFAKSAYLWHSQQRVSLPFVWLLMVAVVVVARIHGNFNLAFAVFSIGTFTALLGVILQTEESDFVTIYLNANHFMRRTFAETVFNATLFALPIIVLLFALFPAEWKWTVLAFPAVILLSVSLLWMKYIFYPSALLAAVFYFFGIALQVALVSTAYGIVLLPVYYYALFASCQKRMNKLLSRNEISVN